MRAWIRQLDQILRGEATRLPALREGTIQIPAGGLSVVLIILGMIYGLCMACFALIRHGDGAYLQLIASMLKVPARW